MPLTIESRIIERAQEAPKALEPLMAAVWPEAYRLALTILRDRGLAEDAAQEACATIARSLTSLKNLDAFPAWCYKIIVRHALASARRRPHTRSLDALADLSVGFDRSDTLDLYDALAALTPLQRAAILLHYYAGLTSAEIAAATGIPSSTVRFHLMRARRALRAALSVGSNSLSYDGALTNVH